MKKLVATVLAVLTSGAVYALPLGNPSEPTLFLNGPCVESHYCDPWNPDFNWLDAWSLRVGFYGDYVFNRHLEVNDEDFSGDIDETKIFTNACYLALNILDRIDIFSTLGASKLHIHTGISSFSPTLTNSFIGLYFENKFSWSVGARATLWGCGGFIVGIEGQYFRTSPNVNSVFNYADSILTYFDSEDVNRRVTYQEWQGGLALSYRFETSKPRLALIPYTGVKWSSARLNFQNDLTIIDADAEVITFHNLKANKLWGYAVGTTLTLCDTIGVNVEGRWGDEKAVSILAQFRF